MTHICCVQLGRILKTISVETHGRTLCKLRHVGKQCPKAVVTHSGRVALSFMWSPAVQYSGRIK